MSSSIYRAEAAAALQQLEVVRTRLEVMLRGAHDRIDALTRENAHIREENARLRRVGQHASGEYAVDLEGLESPRRIG